MKWIINPNKKSHSVPSLFSTHIIEEIHSVHSSFSQYQPTPLYSLSSLAAEFHVGSIHIKDESCRFGLSSFKVLGGAYAIHKILSENPELKNPVFITATDGNHGCGIAWTASQLHLPSYVLMPKGSSLERLQNIKKYGANAWITDKNYDDTVRDACQLAKENNWILVQDTAFPDYEKIPTWIMQGYSTMVAEALEQIKNTRLTHVFIQAGVGSLAGGIAAYLANTLKDECPKIIIVESDQADCIYQTAKANDGSLHCISGNLHTIMAGLACGEPSTVGWNILKHTADCFIACDDSIAADSIRILANPLDTDPVIHSGESGAAGFGTLMEILSNPDYKELKKSLGINQNSHILCFVTEGITDHTSYRDIIWRGRYSRFCD